MNNRITLALAVAGGYVLGRTKKGKLAFGVATGVMGKRLKLSPQAVGALVTDQMEKNPQLKELGGQIRESLGGAGKAAAGALVTRQVDGLADRLHDRTRGVQERLSGTAGQAADVVKGGRRDEDEDEHEDKDEAGRSEGRSGPDDEGPDEEEAEEARPRRQKAPAKKAPAKRAAAKKSTGAKASAKKAPAKKTPAKKSGTKEGRRRD